MPSASKEPETAVDWIKRDIVSGVLQPGLQLKMRELLPRYGVGASPMREVLARLSVEGFVQQDAGRGFRVPPISMDDLLDLVRSREVIEAEAVRLAIRNASAAWEDEIVASFHVFERAVAVGQSDEADFAASEPRHHRFHRALIASCPFATLREFCDSVYVRMTRYRLLLGHVGFSPSEVVAEHRLLMDAVLSRDGDRAAAAIRSHIEITADVLLDRLKSKDGGRTRSGRRTNERRPPKRS